MTNQVLLFKITEQHLHFFVAFNKTQRASKTEKVSRASQGWGTRPSQLHSLKASQGLVANGLSSSKYKFVMLQSTSRSCYKVHVWSCYIEQVGDVTKYKSVMLQSTWSVILSRSYEFSLLFCKIKWLNNSLKKTV